MLRKTLIRSLLCVLTIVSALAIVRLVWAWRIERTAPTTCSPQFEPASTQLQYIEIQLNRQHPIEPSFMGVLYAYFQNSAISQPFKLRVIRSPDRGYAQSAYELDMVTQDGGKTLQASRQVDFDLVTTIGLHRDFPFDSAAFDFTLELDPRVVVKMIRITNRVSGFLLDCSGIRAERHADAGLHITFTLARSPLLQIAAIALALGTLVFFIFIIKLNQTQSLAAAAASFFFSIWSIRKVFESEIHVFPTLFDCVLLTECVMLVLALAWRVFFLESRKIGEASVTPPPQSSTPPAPPQPTAPPSTAPTRSVHPAQRKFRKKR